MIVAREREKREGLGGINTLIGANNLDGVFYSDNIYGGDGNDLIRGRGGLDSLYGDRGNDTLYGGSGSDYLQGGEGSDRFIIKFWDASADTFDHITDFSKEEDTLVLFGDRNNYEIGVVERYKGLEEIGVVHEPSVNVVASFSSFTGLSNFNLDGSYVDFV